MTRQYESMWIELPYQRLEQLERRVLVMALGLLDAVQRGFCSPDDAEAILFKPAVQISLQEHNVSMAILDFIQQGFFLDDVLQHRGAEALEAKVQQMERLATALLQVVPNH